MVVIHAAVVMKNEPFINHNNNKLNKLKTTQTK